jgi:hypothetical protein
VGPGRVVQERRRGADAGTRRGDVALVGRRRRGADGEGERGRRGDRRATREERAGWRVRSVHRSPYDPARVVLADP